jgi:hypothetical protein
LFLKFFQISRGGQWWRKTPKRRRCFVGRQREKPWGRLGEIKPIRSPTLFQLMRLLFCAICLLCLTFFANAQVSLGVSGGANMTYWKWKIKTLNYDIGFDPAIGWRSAAVADWRFSPILGLRAELGYQVLSNRMELTFTTPDDPEGESGRYNERYHCWTSSLLAGITPFRNKKMYFLAGTSAARISAGWSRVSGDLVEPGAQTRKKIDLENFNRTQYFADFGAGIRFPVGKGSLITEVRYQAGLSNLAGVPTVDARISTLGLNVGYLFQL